jgi:hypothetical protein
MINISKFDVKKKKKFEKKFRCGWWVKGANGKQIPSWGFITETVQFQGKMFTSGFLQAAVAGPILGIDFLRKFKITVAPETSQILFACTAAAPPGNFFAYFCSVSCCPSCSAGSSGHITISRTASSSLSGEHVQF